jgi:hypothetical protein
MGVVATTMDMAEEEAEDTAAVVVDMADEAV